MLCFVATRNQNLSRLHLVLGCAGVVAASRGVAQRRLAPPGQRHRRPQPRHQHRRLGAHARARSCAQSFVSPQTGIVLLSNSAEIFGSIAQSKKITLPVIKTTFSSKSHASRALVPFTSVPILQECVRFTTGTNVSQKA